MNLKFLHFCRCWGDRDRVIKEGLPSICSILFLLKRMHYYLCNKMHLDNNGKTVACNTDPALMHSINAYWENGEMKISMLHTAALETTEIRPEQLM